MKLQHCFLLAWISIFSEQSVHATTCRDITVQLAPDRDASADRQRIWTDLALYMLTGLSQDRSCESDQLMTINCGNLAWDSCAELDTPVSYAHVRERYQNLHLSSIAVRDHAHYVPPTLAGMTAATSYQSWETQIVAPSRIKMKTRVIYRSPVDFPIAMSVAETYDTETAELTAPRLETELAIRRQEGNYEFYAYNAAGKLVDYSQFPAGPKPAPTICVSCHYDSSTRLVDRFIPDRN